MNNKSNIEKAMPAKGDGSEAKALKQLEFQFASETPEEETDLDILSTLKELPQWLKENPGKDVMDFYEEKGLIIKRIELEDGGKVIDLQSYLKQRKKPKIKKIDLAKGDFNTTVSGLSSKDKDLIRDLLRKSGVIIGE